jgi:surface carbohydrate biosynthesis protein (TIGR04326 family)
MALAKISEPSLESATDRALSLLIWDAEGAPPVGSWTTALWRSFGVSATPDAISIPKLVEEQADTLKARYLAWIHELGETRIKGKRLVDHLDLRPGFSYWWMSLLVEKSYGKSPRLYDAVRLFALEDLTQELHTRRIMLISQDQALATAFQFWCRSAGMDFEWKRSEQSCSQVSLRKRIIDLLPDMVQSAARLVRYLWQRWPLRHTRKGSDASVSAEITFVDYLIHLDRGALATGRFASNYWIGLTGAFAQAKTAVNWLHLYVQHEAVPTTESARDLLAQFNHNCVELESHTSLDGELSFLLAFAALRDYARLAWQSWRLGGIKHHFRPAGSHLDLWPIFKQDWLDSVRGSTAVWNCLTLNLCEKALRRLPRQKLGVYLQENQGWEMAFIYAWKVAGHGNLIGVPHTTVRYWDLRYFHDPRSYVRCAKNDLPMPDQVALNGPMAMSAYRDGGYPEDEIVEVEALRYAYLTTKGLAKIHNTDSPAPLRVLVCGDILPAMSQQMMGWLVSAARDLPANTRYTVKPHPACAIRANIYPSLTLYMTNAPLVELLSDCDVVFTSNSTSASVDIYCAALPVIQVLDANTFNMSPLRGLTGVVYATDPTELAAALGNTQKSARVLAEPYFCLDKKLPRWCKLLGIM